MEIRHYDKGVSRKLLARFMENRLIFGISRQYESLISPSSTCLTEEEVRGLEEDLAHLWALYRIWTILYLKSVDGSEADWIRRFTEHELTGQ
ncbi:MAG: hypothetical protein FJY85_02105, partial [Deltaproteobacteria bacterium]|nr:hypothetical protein [Deltaproteobacteria bacterium]